MLCMTIHCMLCMTIHLCLLISHFAVFFNASFLLLYQ